MAVPARPPIRYHGSKWRIAPWIIAQFPEHSAYVEVFGGGAGVLLRKPRSTVEVYNDLDEQVVNFYQVLRNPKTCDELLNSVALTPFSRQEFKASYEPSLYPVEAARRFAVRCYMGDGTCSIDPRDSNGFRSCDIRAGKSYAREWAGIPNAIADAAERFIGVTIECMDFRKLIPKFDNSDTLFYIDPPYPMATRAAGGKGYVHELSDHCHRQLAWMLNNIRGKAAVSGYACDLLDGLYADWNRTEKQTTANGQVGAVKRTEVLWRNY
jgi:DNA adenine methylase